MSDSEKLLQEISSALGAGQFARASSLADLALAGGINHPLAHKARALRFDELGRNQDALESFLAARALDPRDPLVYNGIAISLARMGRMKDAMSAFEASLALEPNLASTHFQIGWALELHGESATARTAYRRAVEITPHHASAWTGLAAAAEAASDWPEAKAAATRALALDPRQPRAISSLAAAEIQDGAFERAQARLRAALDQPGFVPPHLRPAMFGLLADALDGLGKPAEAFSFYTAENEARRASFPAPSPETNLVTITQRLIAFCEGLKPGQFSARASDTPRRHIFLLGFQRSGTTLLEQVLSAHPDIVTLEECDALEDYAQTYLADPAGPGRLLSLSDGERDKIREDYWRRVGEFGVDARGKTLVDKLPLNTIKLPLIAALFPDAKILFALRDPRDVVLSCFRRHFKVNSSTYEFLTLRGTAEFYASVMRLGELAREKLPVAIHLLRNEDLVWDFEREMRKLCDFAGIAWTERFHDFAEVARTRNIRSMSAAQVRRGLNSDGAGQWRRYASQLEPVFPILQPWIEKFGYERN